MEEELKQRWVKALRSGEYKQGKGALRDKGDQYCCLGVLLDIEDHSSWNEEQYETCCVWQYKDEYDDKLIADTEFTEDLKIRFDVNDDLHSVLIQMNDGMEDWEDNPQSFDQIADYIEENL